MTYVYSKSKKQRRKSKPKKGHQLRKGQHSRRLKKPHYDFS